MRSDLGRGSLTGAIQRIQVKSGELVMGADSRRVSGILCRLQLVFGAAFEVAKIVGIARHKGVLSPRRGLHLNRDKHSPIGFLLWTGSASR